MLHPEQIIINSFSLSKYSPISSVYGVVSKGVAPMLQLLKESITTVRFQIPVSFRGKDNRDAVQHRNQQVFTFTSYEGEISRLLHFAIHDDVMQRGRGLLHGDLSRNWSKH